MKIFTTLYDKALQWARHPKATWYLSGMSFAESSFFPVPPDVMLMPMSLATPKKAFYYAWLTTIFSLLGGLLGYAVGYWAIDLVLPFIETVGYTHKVEQIQVFFAEYGIWVILIAGFSPVPYKLFTLMAGASSMALLPFVVASFIGRGARFYLVAGLMKWGGARMEAKIRQWVDWLGWGFVVLLVVFLVSRYYIV